MWYSSVTPSFDDELILGLFCFSTITTICLAWYAWTRRSAGSGTLTFSLLMVAQTFWALFAGLELLFEAWPTKRILLGLMYVGVLSSPILLLVFAAQLAGSTRWLTVGNLIRISLIPASTLIVIWTNPLHRWYWTSHGEVERYGLSIADVDRGILYWPNLLYCYGLSVLAIALLFRTAWRLPWPFRGQAIICGSGAIVPMLANIVDRLGYNPVYPVDLAPMTAGFSGLLIGVGLLRYRMFDLVPIAYEQVVQRLRDPVLVIDSKGRLVQANSAAWTLLGVGPNRAIGYEVHHLLPTDSEIAIRLARAEADQFEWVDAVGRVFDVEIIGLTSRGRNSGWIVVAHDITSHHAAAETERTARVNADAANLAKSQFLATMSHEIRTPIHVMTGMAQMLAATKLTSSQRDCVESLTQASDHLIALIDNLLEYSRIESQQIELTDIPFELQPTLMRIVSMIEPLCRRKQLGFEVEIAHDAPAHVRGDPIRLAQITLNLLSNAVKFTEVGRIGLQVRWSVPRSEALLRIRDTGIGIAESDLDRIFERFTQVDASLTRRRGGIGLGLSISKRLIELMGGALSVQSRLGQGTLFRIVLPLREADPTGTTRLEDDLDPTRIATASTAQMSETAGIPEAVAMPESIAESSTKPEPSEPKLGQTHPLQILVAEDDRMSLKLIQDMLRRLGYRAEFVEDGRRMVERACGGDPFDVILTDIQMPEMDGLEAAAEIRKRLARDHQPRIIALSANASDVRRRAAVEAGLDEFLGKPFRATDLAAVLRRCAPIPARRTDVGDDTDPDRHTPGSPDRRTDPDGPVSNGQTG